MRANPWDHSFQIWQNHRWWQWLWWPYGHIISTNWFIFKNHHYATSMDYYTKIEKRSRWTRGQSEEVVYGDGRTRVATGIAPILKHTPWESFSPAAQPPTLYYPAQDQETKYQESIEWSRSPTLPLTSPPLGAQGNLIIIEDSSEELDGWDNNFYTAELTFSTPVSFLLHCQECEDWTHRYFECPQYICDYCCWWALMHRVSDCPRHWSQWLQP